ncbi:hypothetical protein WM40_20790 [Robbsia andropogonis]|uniref:Uncharacterized protein n=1 Tax=Robbsia andropogonis TaxID=28092 RepID=A0A0F5JX46_9BURK|nr:hypothetical protein WM40_20790 [Robbsia andropogonis]
MIQWGVDETVMVPSYFLMGSRTRAYLCLVCTSDERVKNHLAGKLAAEQRKTENKNANDYRLRGILI